METEISDFVIGDNPFRLVYGWGEATHLARIGRERAICGYEATVDDDEASVPTCGRCLRIATRSLIGSPVDDRVGPVASLVVEAIVGCRYVRVDDRWPWGGAWMASPPPGPDSILWSWPVDEPLWLGRPGIDEFAELWALEPTVDELPEISAANHKVGSDGAGESNDIAEPSDETGEGDGSTAGEYRHDGVSDGGPEAGTERDTVDSDASPDPSDSIGSDEPSVPEPADGTAGHVERNDQIADTYVEATVALRATDIDKATLKLPERFEWFLGRIASSGEVFVRLSHDGDIDDDQRSQQLDAVTGESVVGPVNWPLDFFPGIHLHVAAIPGMPTLYLSTRIADDGSGFVADSAATSPSNGRTVTLAGLAVDALRRVGRSSYGSKRATGIQIAAALFGSDCPAVLCAAVIDALEVLYAAGRLAKPGTEYSITDTASDPTRTRFVPAGRQALAPTRHEVRAHVVPNFLRRLPSGHRASAAQEALYLREYGRALASGWTFVREHQRGEHVESYRSAHRRPHRLRCRHQ